GAGARGARAGSVSAGSVPRWGPRLPARAKERGGRLPRRQALVARRPRLCRPIREHDRLDPADLGRYPRLGSPGGRERPQGGCLLAGEEGPAPLLDGGGKGPVQLFTRVERELLAERDAPRRRAGDRARHQCGGEDGPFPSRHGTVRSKQREGDPAAPPPGGARRNEGYEPDVALSARGAWDV